jgi:hypothetical protein
MPYLVLLSQYYLRKQQSQMGTEGGRKAARMPPMTSILLLGAAWVGSSGPEGGRIHAGKCGLASR